MLESFRRGELEQEQDRQHITRLDCLEQHPLVLQEGGWTPYPTFQELHQILYRSELNMYENFQLPPGITPGDEGSHVNDKAIDMFKRLSDRAPRFIVEVCPLFISFIVVLFSYYPVLLA